MGSQKLLTSIGMDPDVRRKVELDEKWLCYSYNHNGSVKEVPVILIERGPKSMTEVKQKLRRYETCVILLEERSALFLKTPISNRVIPLESNEEYERVSSILGSSGIADATTELDMMIGITKSIESIQTATADFDNRGIFSTHYLRNRLFGDIRRDITSEVDRIKPLVGITPDKILKALGWNKDRDSHVSVVTTTQDDFSIRSGSSDVAPSYTAISYLKQSKWVILTNGKRWRLYTNNISASSTNYFEISLDMQRDSTIRYLAAIFGAATFEETDGKRDIDVFFTEGKRYAADLEEDLASRIMSPDGLFLDIIKGVLNHDMKTKFTASELEEAKETALKILYRVWFLAYAESRNLLPTKDAKYRNIALQTVRDNLDSYEDPRGHECWDSLCVLFKGIREGSREHNLPQYNGDLFSYDPSIDGIIIKNHFIVDALHSLLERDGEPMDYASLGVRHLGNIFESLMEFSVKQTDHDMMLLEDKKGVREVATKAESTYSYKKNDLYLASKDGITTRKSTASFYTPDKIVTFLVRQGLESILDKRSQKIADDIQRYTKTPSTENLQICLDRLLDIQVLDPAMGSGHFLVEVLNQITQWAMEMLKEHPTHPLLKIIEDDRISVLDEQKANGITIDASLLTYDVLLKRRIMKRCIFGVDLNPLAVELARVSLWLDSFAIGVPLTYLDHHIKHGDSTIGAWLDDLQARKNTSLDDWAGNPEESSGLLERVSDRPDVTIQQVSDSRTEYEEYKEQTRSNQVLLDVLTASHMDKTILPKKSKENYIYMLAKPNNTDKTLKLVRRRVTNLAERYHFFHWELEMMDAFTDDRRGFDLIVGNPPWQKVIPYDDDFFSLYDPLFTSLSTKTLKKKRITNLLKSDIIRDDYTSYKNKIQGENNFYDTYQMQGVGHKDRWQLVLEQVLKLLHKDGVLSMVLPSQSLSSNGPAQMRKALLEKDISSLYVFENKKGIFGIHKSYRFVLLTVKNHPAQSDEFPAAFYLHSAESLEGTAEGDKFITLSRSAIITMSPDRYVIPEKGAEHIQALKTLFQNPALESYPDWTIKRFNGFNRTSDANLLNTSGHGWPVLGGGSIHQFNHRFSTPKFVAGQRAGLERLKRGRVLAGKVRAIHNGFRLAFRDRSSPTNTRSVLSAVIPPHVFNTNKLIIVILFRNEKIELGVQADIKTAYLCGVLNSMSFDFATRSRLQMDVAPIIFKLPIPNPSKYDQEISECAAKLCVGSPEFEPFSESVLGPDRNITLTPAQRIHVTARLDAMVAHAYGLTKQQYGAILDSFKFKEDPSLLDAESADWGSNKVLKCFYGEVRKRCIPYFEEHL